MEFWMFVFCVIPAIAQSITISPNGNSPEVKMAGGMLSDVPLGFVPISSKSSKGTKSDTHSGKNLNTTRLSLNERYRRLIPYMTFYYANDAASPTEDTKNIEVEKAQIVEAGTFNENQRQPKVIYSSHRHNNIPRYQGNRLTQHNIASANPSRFYYKEVPVLYQNSPKVSSNYNPLLLDHNVLDNQDNNFVRFIPKQIKSPSAPFTPINRKPAVNIYNSNDAANVQYYIFEKDPVPKYKLIPYEQTPPIKYVPEIENVDLSKKHPPLNLPKESVYINQRPVRPQYFYDSVNTQTPKTRKPPTIISESYYEKRPTLLVQPVIESGFRPIIGSSILTTETPTYVEAPTQSHEAPLTSDLEQKNGTPLTNSLPLKPVDNAQYQYVVEQPTQRPEENKPSNTITLADLLNSLQLNKAIPKPITRENIGSSIRTLLQVLTALKATPPQNDVDPPVLSTPKPFEAPVIPAVTTISPVQSTLASEPEDTDFHEEPYLAPVQTPSQHLDDYPLSGSTSQRFPLPITSDDEGGTPGRPGVDYPILTVIPPTKFNCKTQRYKGFFADPETRCQVWHYCDLNGGQASFLCPNGTIFSQAGLTCDWWFNVRCASTTQLYVLNESLYKYILPHSPKFPEDYSGPLVDKYLTLKFKEMEEQFKKNKNKQTAKDKVDSNEDDSSENSSEEKDSTVSSTDTSLNSDKSVESDVGRADVVIDSPGTSGNVERLQEK
ncbi:uncharacterized protein [Epargyreus clarus]|uniref:uncharacterized protein n=1 Tax=Epargyreus clarus TaxID=520877 RepID=UPI003C2F008A